MAHKVGKRNFRRKRITPRAEDFSQGDFSRPLAFTQQGMDAKNAAQEKAVVKEMTKLLGPVPKGKSLGT